MESRSQGSGGPPRLADNEPGELRYRTLVRLEEVLRLLVEAHGSRITLGEMLAITAAMARLCRKPQVTIAEIAEATGLPKQNLSRWARKRVGRSISLRVNENDQRMHDVILVDALRGQKHIERLAPLLGTDVQKDS